MPKPTIEETDALWNEYKRGPDYQNVMRWLSDDAHHRPPTPVQIEDAVKHLFRSAILCATDPGYLAREPASDPIEARSEGDE